MKKKNVSARFLCKASLGLSMLVRASCLGGVVWLTWRPIGPSPDPQLPWDSDVLFFWTDPCSVSPHKLHGQASRCVAGSGHVCPMCSIASYWFSFCPGAEMATWPAHLGDTPRTDLSGPARSPSLFIVGPGVLLKWGET